MKRQNQEGFTIVELMIATTVLSTLLVLVTIIMMSIGSLFYKGVNQSRVQDSVRGIADDVSKNIQLNGDPPKAQSAPLNTPLSGVTVYAYCVGEVRYSYIKDHQIGSDFTGKGQVPHVLWRDTKSGPTCDPVDLTGSVSSGSELIAPNSRLTAFSISTFNPPYSVTVAQAYGDSDLLNPAGLNTTCKDTKGDQFCATASLQTVVGQRLGN
jgi:prepilin-type N-terminal cleavage/methylation domain-containing protein